jgi:hypothetical protein
VNLVDEAEALMLHQFNDSKRLKGLIHSFITPLQSAADIITELSNGCYIQRASHYRLDIKGKLVGQTRHGLGDEDLRKWIGIRILLNSCSGTPEQLIEILRRLLGNTFSFSVLERPPNNVLVIFFHALEAPASMVLGVVKLASPLGLKHHFIQADLPIPFRFDVSAFSDSQFADFYAEEPYERI